MLAFASAAILFAGAVPQGVTAYADEPDAEESVFEDTVTDSGMILTTGDEMLTRSPDLEAEAAAQLAAERAAAEAVKARQEEVSGAEGIEETEEAYSEAEPYGEDEEETTVSGNQVLRRARRSVESVEEAAPVGAGKREEDYLKNSDHAHFLAAYLNGTISNVLNQGNSALCWAFAGLDSAQINLISSGAVREKNMLFSPYHLASASFSRPDRGDEWKLPGGTPYATPGNYQVMTSTLAKYWGAASASYNEDKARSLTSVQKTDAIAHLKSTRQLTNMNAGLTEKDRSSDDKINKARAASVGSIKKFIDANKAVTLSFRADGYDRDTNSYYHSSLSQPTHQVIVVGYNEFKKTRAEVPGAFLIKNTWGTSSGRNGYAWLSFQDLTMCDPCVFDFEYGTLRDRSVYYYDGTGNMALKKADEGKQSKYANVFTTSYDDVIDQVGIYVPAGGSYQIELRTGLKTELPDSGYLAARAEKAGIETGGYYVIPLDKPVSVPKGKKFAVIVQTLNAAGESVISAEVTQTKYRVMSSSPKQSYIVEYPVGGKAEFRDFYGSKVEKDGSYKGVPYGNVCIKAYGRNAAPQPAPKPVTVAKRAMYRVYNPNSGEHFYTASLAEKNHLVSVGWRYEGIAWYAPVSGSPVYRMYNPNAGDHHYTLSVKERDMLIGAGWNYEGVSWYSGGPAPLYRAYNPNARAGSHHYTLSRKEIDSIVRAGWRYEGISWYGYPS